MGPSKTSKILRRKRSGVRTAIMTSNNNTTKRSLTKTIMMASLLLFPISSTIGQQCTSDLLQMCTPCCEEQQNSVDYNCSLPGLDSFTPGLYEGVSVNYLSFVTETSSPNLPFRAKEFEECTGGKIVFSEAANVWENPIQDLGTKTSRGSEVYDGYFMSYSHFPEASALDLAEHLNDRIRHSNDRLKWEDVLPKVRENMGKYRKNGIDNIDFLMYDGDFFVPIIRLDLLEAHNLSLPNTWEEVVTIAKYFNNTDLNNDGLENDYGFCHFPRLGAGYWDWWWPEALYSTWATLEQTQGIDQGFFFNEETMEPHTSSQAFIHSAQIWKDLWTHGSDGCITDNFVTGRCAIGFSPPGCWKGVFLNPDGVNRKDENGTIIWRPTMKSGEYAEPYRFKPFGSTQYYDRNTNEMKTCLTEEDCPKAEVIPERGHVHDNDRASILVKSPLAGQLINRAPFYWSGGLGTLIRKSSEEIKKDLMWDFFVYTNSPDTSVYDVANYASWLDSWRYSQLTPGNNFLDAGWSTNAYTEHASVMQWALSSESNGALNLRIPGLVEYTRDTVGELMGQYIADDITINQLSTEVTTKWEKITMTRGKLDQLEIYRNSLGLDSQSDVELCRLHRDLMDERDPSTCRVYDDENEDNDNDVNRIVSVLLPAILVPSFFILFLILLYLIIDRKRKNADSVWSIKSNELHFENPPEVLGRGTFGLVLLAEYRGTNVAVKRVIPPKESCVANNSTNKKVIPINPYGSDDSPTKVDQSMLVDEPSSTTRNNAEQQVNNKIGGYSATSNKDIGYTSGSTAGLTGSYDGSKTTTKLVSIVDPLSKTNTPTTNNIPRCNSDQNIGSSIPIENKSKMKRRNSLDLYFDANVEENNESNHARTGKKFAYLDDSTNDMVDLEQNVIPRREGAPPSLEAEAELNIDNNGDLMDQDSRNNSKSSSDDTYPQGNLSSSLGKMARRFSNNSNDGSVVSVTIQNRHDSGSILSSLGRTSQSLELLTGNKYNSKSRRHQWSGWLKSRFKYRDEYRVLKEDFVDEMRYLSKLRHPCITTVMGAVIAKKEEPMLVMEYMDHGSLYDVLHNETVPLDGDVLLPVLRDIAQGMRFLHAASPKVIHGDLKAHNVLVDNKFRAKVADFGLSAKKAVGATGTPFWMAPELLRGESGNTAASDVYSFGIILYEVYSRKDPFDGEDLRQVLKDIADPNVQKRPPVPTACPTNLSSLMTDCLTEDPDLRPSFEEIDLRLKRLDTEMAEPGETYLTHRLKQQSRSDSLLFEVFPRHIAEALREGRKIEPERKDVVTIFFSDVVGFTNIASILSPEKVSEMLDRLYLGFDDLSRKHDVFKLETIGDAYMCVTNLVKEQNDDHAKRIADFAVDAIHVASNTLIDVDDPSMGNLRIRVGFHSGPVIANVVGSRLPKYSIFGDTVNTAARMESNSLPGKIQCSERAADILRNQCPEMKLVSRGNIAVKGKGEMETFFVERRSTGIRHAPDEAKQEKVTPLENKLQKSYVSNSEPEQTTSSDDGCYYKSNYVSNSEAERTTCSDNGYYYA